MNKYLKWWMKTDEKDYLQLISDLLYVNFIQYPIDSYL
jgi:hypothetical protein